METMRLNHFCRVYEHCSIRKSSDVLHLSAGTISKSIKALEKELGEILFVAEGRGIVPTDFAHLLYPKALDIINQISQLKSKNEVSPVLKIAVGESTGTFLIASHLSKYFDTFQVSLYQLESGDVERAIAAKQIDWALTFEPQAHEGIAIHSLAKIPMNIYVSKKHQLKQHEELEFIVPTVPLGKIPTFERGQDGWPDHILPRKIKFRVDGLHTAIKLTCHSSSAIYLPEFVGGKIDELKVCTSVKMPKVQQRTLYLLTRHGDDLRKECKRFASMVRTVLTKN